MANAVNILASPSAQSIIKRFQQTAPVDVIGIAEDLGMTVWEEKMQPWSGKLEVDPQSTDGLFRIVVNIQESESRKRFTIAHEVAHFILHKSDIDRGGIVETLYRGGLSDKKEREANQLAAEILMPLPLIRNLMSTGITKVSDLAQTLQVSRTAVAIRLGLYYAD